MPLLQDRKNSREVLRRMTLIELYRIAQRHRIIRRLSIAGDTFQFFMPGVQAVTLDECQARAFMAGMIKINPQVFGHLTVDEDLDEVPLGNLPQDPDLA